MMYFLLLLGLTQAADLNVGTTLFTKADSLKECWSSENLALLTSRMILEDLLPSPSILVIDCDEFVTDLVEYFRLIMETVRSETQGKSKHVTLTALTDLLGGYLHHAVLPIAKYAYYAGNIDYDSMASLLGLFDELKWFLRSDGQGWAKPMPQSVENYEVQRLNLQSNDKDSCKDLIQINEGTCKNCGEIIIPIPFFDSVSSPSSIALPFKSSPLYNIEVNTSSYVVLRFFIKSYKCLSSKNVKPDSLMKFGSAFGAWMEGQVLPRLGDDKFYSAFGGILRARGMISKLRSSQGGEQIDFELPESEVPKPKPKQMSRKAMILMASLITLVVWFILGTSFVCYRIRAKKKQKEEDTVKTTTCSLDSSKYFYPEPPPECICETSPESESDSDEKPGCILSKAKQKCQEKLQKFKKEKASTSSSKSEKKSRRQRRTEIFIKTCQCDDKNAALIDSNHTEGRLPSITEMSELSTTDQAASSGRSKKISFPPTTTSTPKSTTTDGRSSNQVNRSVYEESPTETTESTD